SSPTPADAMTVFRDRHVQLHAKPPLSPSRCRLGRPDLASHAPSAGTAGRRTLYPSEVCREPNPAGAPPPRPRHASALLGQGGARGPPATDPPLCALPSLSARVRRSEGWRLRSLPRARCYGASTRLPPRPRLFVGIALAHRSRSEVRARPITSCRSARLRI